MDDWIDLSISSSWSLSVFLSSSSSYRTYVLVCVCVFERLCYPPVQLVDPWYSNVFFLSFLLQYSTVELILKSVERWRTVDMETAPTCKYTRSIPWRHLFHDFFSETGMYLYARTYTTNDRTIFLVRRSGVHSQVLFKCPSGTTPAHWTNLSPARSLWDSSGGVLQR